jgi:hypothetical protein
VSPRVAWFLFVCNYSLNSAGLNLQHLCRNFRFFSAALSKSVVDRAIERVARLGQEHIVFVYEYRLRNSFDMELADRSKVKAIPTIIALMSQEVFESSNSNGRDELDIGIGVVRKGDLVPLQDGGTPALGDLTDEDTIVRLSWISSTNNSDRHGYAFFLSFLFFSFKEFYLINMVYTVYPPWASSLLYPLNETS